ncbi:FecR family protein [Pedobacter hiemivivus]|uniref:FecR family protein n=1 Tax=Pedobacter hiemivivus TaxID=2530454 RepID=A0A4U1G4A9_9SPHI|nr:FecR family protein [Pedobacter hiemivivus]TKC57213.1 FecR family protein [Pedobacter hiemivivus]
MLGKDILELVNQESFLNYCFKRNSDDVQYWEEWLQKNPEDRKQIDDFRKMLISMGQESRKRVNDANFAELQHKIAQSKVNINPKSYPLWKRWGIAAAAVLLIVGGGLFISQNTGEIVDIVNAKDISPGGNSAILILANGQKVDLEQVANGGVMSQSGIKVVKKADGQIIYEISDVAEKTASDQYNTIETPIGGQYQVNLSDGTKVWLNSGSSLRYPVKFVGAYRNVELKGEGYFEVSKNKAMPFKVNNSRQTVEVLGTHFNIMAYADEPVVKTTLLEGVVKVSAGKASALLASGQQSKLEGAKVNVIDHVDLEDAVAWKNGYFKFNESLESIMSKISRWYGVEVIYETIPERDLTYSGKISRSRNISAVLKIIGFNSDVRFKIEGKKVYVIK